MTEGECPPLFGNGAKVETAPTTHGDGNTQDNVALATDAPLLFGTAPSLFGQVHEHNDAQAEIAPDSSLLFSSEVAPPTLFGNCNEPQDAMSNEHDEFPTFIPSRLQKLRQGDDHHAIQHGYPALPTVAPSSQGVQATSIYTLPDSL